MQTFYSIIFSIVLLTLGLLPIGIGILLVWLMGAPGAIINAWGEKINNKAIVYLGLYVCFFGQLYLCFAYTVFAVGAMRALIHNRPEIVTWPIWVAVFLHSNLIPAYCMKEKPETITAQYTTIAFVGIFSFIFYWLIVFAPNWVKLPFLWVAFSSYLWL